MAFVCAGAVAFAGNTSVTKKLTVDKAISCFVKSLKAEAFTPSWNDGGRKDFMKKVKGNENYPVLGDELSKFISIYLDEKALANSADKTQLVKDAAAANTENTVAKILWRVRQQINPLFITEKGQKMIDKYDGELQALAS